MQVPQPIITIKLLLLHHNKLSHWMLTSRNVVRQWKCFEWEGKWRDGDVWNSLYLQFDKGKHLNKVRGRWESLYLKLRPITPKICDVCDAIAGQDLDFGFDRFFLVRSNLVGNLSCVVLGLPVIVILKLGNSNRKWKIKDKPEKIMICVGFTLETQLISR